MISIYYRFGRFLLGTLPTSLAVPSRQQTRNDYKAALNRFYAFVDFRFVKKPTSPEALRFACAEFVNFLYQDDRPIGWAGNFLSAMKRFHPSTVDSLGLARQYHTNWSRSIKRAWAFPYTVEMVQAMAVVLVHDQQPFMAIAVLLAFIGLFRLGEILALRLRDFDFVAPDFCIITLMQTKARKGPVSVIVRDPSIIVLLKAVCRANSPEQLLVPNKYRDFSTFLRKFAFFLSLPGDRFTGHGFRRGGATHFFRTSRSYDLTQRQGRWACTKTCQLYIDEALAEKASLALPPRGAAFLSNALLEFKDTMRSLL